MKRIKIGKLELDTFVYIPPMAGVTDIAYRKMVRLFDKDTLMSTEMVSSKALMFRPDQAVMKLTTDEHPVGIQLFGHETEAMSHAAKLAEEQGADFVDINMGCPVPKIVRGKDGAALMKEPDLACEVAKAVIESVKIPVTVKMRLGWDSCNKNSPELAMRLEDIGVCAFTVHGRTRAQAYTGSADWEAIRKVKEKVSVPVFGNGDVRNPYDAKKLLEISGCDGVAIARATMGAPWLSKQINEYLKTGSFSPEPSLLEKLDLAILHVSEMIKLKGEYVGIRESRRHLINYTKGMPNSSKIRGEVSQVSSIEEAKELINRLKDILLQPVCK